MSTLPRAKWAVILAALFALLVSPVTAQAATPDARGYWWRLQSGSGARLPPPPVVPSGGLWVASDPSGQQALSALRYRAPPNTEIRSVVLRVARSSGSGAVILACPARSAWTPAEAGTWSARPVSACDIAFVRGVRSGDESTWSFDVRGLARTGTLDVVILPPPDAAATFSISFEPPDSSTVAVRRFDSSPSPSSSARAEESPRAGRVQTPTVLSEAPQPAETGAQPPPSFTTPSGDPSGEDSPSTSTDAEAAAPIPPVGSRLTWLYALPAFVLLVAIGASHLVLRRRRPTAGQTPD